MPSLIGRTLYVQNPSLLHSADVWSSCGLPYNHTSSDYPELAAEDSSGTAYRVVTRGKELFVRCPVTANEKRELTIIEATDQTVRKSGAQRGPDRLSVADWVADELDKLKPQFFAQIGGVAVVADPYEVVSTDINPARMRVHIRTKFDQPRLWINAWFDIFDDQEIVEFIILMTMGDVENNNGTGDGTAAATNWPAGGAKVEMYTGERPCVDFRVHKGLPAPSWDGNLWKTVLVDTSTWNTSTDEWFQASNVRIQGALLCAPPYNELTATIIASDPFQNLLHRVGDLTTDTGGARVQCMLSNVDWEGHYGTMGAVPYIEDAGEAANAQAAFYADVHGRWTETTAATENPAFDYSRAGIKAMVYGDTIEPRLSGDHIDYGNIGGVHAIGFNSPGAQYFLMRDLDCWFRRPSIPLAADGRVFTYLEAPAGTITFTCFGNVKGGSTWDFGYNLIANGDLGYNLSGWAWQQKAHEWELANQLTAMYQLTRDPSLLFLMSGLACFYALEEWRTKPDKNNPPLGGYDGNGLYSVRRWVRDIKILCHFYRVGGLSWLRPILEDAADFIYTSCAFHLYAGKDLQPMCIAESNSGWDDPPGSGNWIEGVKNWQEAEGIYTAYMLWCCLTTDDDRRAKMEEIIIKAGRTFSHHMHYIHQGQRYWVQIYRWNNGDTWGPGVFYPAAPASGNLYINTSSSFVYWTIGIMRLYLKFANDPYVAQVVSEEHSLTRDREGAMWGAVLPMRPPQL